MPPSVASPIRVTGTSVASRAAVHFGEDFELVFAVPEASLSAARKVMDVPVTRIGDVTEGGVELNGDPLADRGFTH